ncbi:MAG: DUF1573 domain-containing protein [Sedimentisphaerales bacterium]|nr:DUF1573 domain-containing protein [Sedimentisphaerales bacterium]
MKRRYGISMVLLLAGLLLVCWGCEQPKPEPAPVDSDQTELLSDELDMTAVEPEVKKTTVPQPTPQQRLNQLREKVQQERTSRRDDAGLLVANEALHDFGEVEPQKKLQASFELTNTGTQDLTIKDVQSSCSCLATNLDNKVLKPGQSVPMAVTFTTPDRAGRVVKNVRISTEVPAKPEVLVLQVAARVKQYIQVEPERLEFRLRGGPDGDVSLTVSSTDNQPFQVTNYRSSSSVIQLDLDRQASQTVHKIPVRVDREKLEKSPQGGVLTLDLSHPTSKTISLPYRVLLPYSAHPTVRRFAAIQPGQSATANLDIISNYEEPFELGEVSSEKGYVKVTQTDKLPNGYQLHLEMKVPPNSTQRMPSDYLNVKIKDDPAGTLRVLCYTMTR